MKKLNPHEQKQLLDSATLTVNLSPDTRPEITRKVISEFRNDLLNAIARKRQVKRWVLALIETDGEKS
jgi:hypothetical protein